MSRRSTLPGADELFRSTGEPSTSAAGPSATTRSGSGASAAAAGTADEVPASVVAAVRPLSDLSDEQPLVDERPAARVRRRSRPTGDRRPSGRERHEEKITVYVSPEELMDLEHARLSLRGDHGLAVDRGRIVREALAVVIADLEAKGEASILVRRLHGR
jgi:hypothetical protein